MQPVIEVTPSRTAFVGGAQVRRALPIHARRTIGAWCFLDHFGPAPVTPTTATMVGPHPHLGLQTVTWLLDGELLHRDSLGSDQLIRPGQLNLMSAGSGVAHAEDGRDRGVRSIHGVQLWVAQPEATRHGAAAFEHHAELPVVALGPGTATVMVGTALGVTSPARHDTPLVGVDLALQGPVELSLKTGHEHALVVLSGRLTVDGVRLAVDDLCYLGGGRDTLRLDTEEPTRALLLGGEPFDDDVLMWWNFVARTRGEVESGWQDWETGSERFGEVHSTLERIPAPRPEWLA